MIKQYCKNLTVLAQKAIENKDIDILNLLNEIIYELRKLNNDNNIDILKDNRNKKEIYAPKKVKSYNVTKKRQRGRDRIKEGIDNFKKENNITKNDTSDKMYYEDGIPKSLLDFKDIPEYKYLYTKIKDYVYSPKENSLTKEKTIKKENQIYESRNKKV